MNEETKGNEERFGTPESEEVGRLKYKGYKIPLFIWLVWTALIIWLVVYLARHAWPNLMMWLSK